MILDNIILISGVLSLLGLFFFIGLLYKIKNLKEEEQ